MYVYATHPQGLWYSAETKIERGFYCCYDPFSRLDVRCELCIPGGVVCGALDAEGAVHDVSTEIRVYGKVCVCACVCVCVCVC